MGALLLGKPQAEVQERPLPRDMVTHRELLKPVELWPSSLQLGKGKDGGTEPQGRSGSEKAGWETASLLSLLQGR